MRILITGATGYVGSTLIDDLRGTHEIIATARDISRIPQEGIEKATLDIASPEQVQAVIRATKPDVVIHAAALPKRSTVDEEAFIRTNVEGARNVAEAVRATGARFIMISSGCAFKQEKGSHITAKSAREYDSAFSKSKNLSEQAVAQIFADAPERLTVVYPPVILHRSQVKGVIPYALHDAKQMGIITNKVPDGHVNFITHNKFAELMDAIATDTRKQHDTQRYYITGIRLTTKDFFKKLQHQLSQNFGIECAVMTEADPHVETMCSMDESSIHALKPSFDWGSIDHAISEIVTDNIAKRAIQTQVASSRTGKGRTK